VDEPVAHGALDHGELAALGLRPEGLLDFSSNLNPFGPPEGVRVALAALDPAPYPDRSCRELRLALAARYGRAPAEILPGNGANELIHLIGRALLRPGDAALVVGPTYGEYAHGSRLAGAVVEELAAEPARGFAPDVARLRAAIARARPRITWLCAPNNPTGVELGPAALGELAAACGACDGLLVVDRSYAELRREQPEPWREPPPNLIELHSLTKSHALAGLRLGHLIAEWGIVARIGAYQPAWSVSSAAQAAGLAALADAAFLPRTAPQLWEASDQVRDALAALGLVVWRASAPFLLVRSGDGAATRSALLARGCLVRNCASFGLPAWVRVAPRAPAENARLVAAWKEIL
jgi:threonine-phosphate decarboxylase